MPGSADLLDQRVARARAEMAAAGVDACIVTDVPTIAWLTGFRGTSATLIVSPGWLYFVTDFRYSRAVELLRSAGDLPTGLEVEIAERSGEDRLVAVLRARGARKVAFEAEHLTVDRFRRLERALAPVPLAPLGRSLGHLRAIKDEWEQRIFREAAARLATVAARLPELVRRGRPEREIAADIDHALRVAGFERPAFETIVASGPNSALPHARPTDRRLEPRDPVVLDFGGVYGGYCVDLTRTAVVGQGTGPFIGLFEAVQAAHGAAVASARPGVRASEIDAAARGALAQRGLAEAFGHATGHGLGLEIHEYPRIGRAAPEGENGFDRDPVIAEGMVFTIEPGAYVPSIGGVRIEDDVLIGARGAEILTDIPRDLLVLGA
jgi:Xaa-Pro aminopeptidase